MSEYHTNQAAGRFCREIQGLCLTAARTQLPRDTERATQVTNDLLGSTGPWVKVDGQGFDLLNRVMSYVNSGSFALAAQQAHRAARAFEDNIPSTRG